MKRVRTNSGGTDKRKELLTRKNRLTGLMAQVTSIEGSLSTRAELNARLGFQYGTDRDLYQALGYPVTTSISLEQCLARYSRQDIAKAIIDRPVRATWSGGISLMESNDIEDTEFEKAWDKLARDLSLPEKFLRLDKLTGLGSYGALLLGFDDVMDADGLKKPVAPGKRELLYVKPLCQSSASIETWETNPGNARYGLPNVYKVTVTENATKVERHMSAHFTRVIHVADDLDESEIYGTPRLVAVWNRLMDLEKIMGGSAEMFWRGARPGYAAVADGDAQFNNEDMEELEEQLDEYEHQLRRFITLTAMKLTPLSMQVADPSAHVDVQIQAISAITGIPKRILTGSERGELASVEDRSAWLESIKARRNIFAWPKIVKPFVERMVEYEILPAPKQEDYGPAWEDPFAPSEEDKAKIGEIRARALSYYANAINARDIVTPEAFFEFFMGLDQEQIELIVGMMEERAEEEDTEMAMIEEELRKIGRQAKVPPTPEEE